LSNEWDEYAKSWDVDPTVEVYAKNAFSNLLKLTNVEGLSVLDFGCGTGALTQLISPLANNIVAIDPSSEMIKHLNKKSLKNVSSISDYLSEDLVLNHPEFKHKFDLIVASSVCGFLPDYEATLKLLCTLLKSGGVFAQWDWLAENDNAGMGFTKQRVKEAFELVELNGVQITTPFTMESSKGSMPVLLAVGVNA